MGKTNNLIPTVSLSASWAFDKLHKNRKKIRKTTTITTLHIITTKKVYTPAGGKLNE